MAPCPPNELRPVAVQWLLDLCPSVSMPAHIRTALTATSLGLSFDRGRLVLGTWQAVYLWEHRAIRPSAPAQPAPHGRIAHQANFGLPRQAASAQPGGLLCDGETAAMTDRVGVELVQINH